MSRWQLWLALLPVIASAPLAHAADVSVYTVATSDYVHRGATQSDGNPAIQFGTDVSFDNGLYAGAWASTVDLTGRVTQRDIEARLYAGYGMSIGQRTRINFSAVAYRYPESEGGVNYDNEEYGISIGFDDTFWVEYAYSSDLYDSSWDTHNVELIGERPVWTNWLLSGGIGFYRIDNLTNRDTVYWNIGISRAFRQFDIDLRHHVANEAIPLISRPQSVGSRFAVSLRYNF